MPRTAAAFVLAFAWGAALAQDVVFVREFGLHSNPAGVAVDSSGVYTLRLTRPDPGNQVVSLIKYSAEGAQLWSRQFITSTISDAGGVAVAPHGVYAVGTASRGSISVASFSTAGEMRWTRQIGLAPDAFARGVAADDAGIYVVGQRGRGGVIRKYDSGGAALWTLELDAPGGGYHAPLGVATDATGIYVSGVIQPTGQGIVGFVRKYDRNGAQIWDRQFGLIVRGVAVEPGGVYVVGQDGPSNALRKYDSNGNVLWTRPINEALNHGLTGDLGITAEPEGVYLVSGAFRAVRGQCRQGGEDPVLLKFDSNGNELWSRQFGAYDNDFARTVAVDATGVYVAGNLFLAKFQKTAPPNDNSRPRIVPGCVINAASYLGGGVAAGEIVSILGAGLASELAGTRVLFNGIPATLLHVSQSQINAVVPFAIAGEGYS